jgi:hypothetical protein
MRQVRFTRWTRRAAAVLVGLTLGWYAAGVAQPPLAGKALASQPAPPPTVAPPAATPDAHAAVVQADHVALDHAATAHSDAGALAAGQLVPAALDAQGHAHAALPAWFNGTIALAGGLFLAALVIGLPIVLRAASTPPPAVAADAHAH